MGFFNKLLIIIAIIILAGIFLVPLSEGTIGQQHYNVPVSVSICGVLLGAPEGQMTFGQPEKTLFSIPSTQFCIAGVCNIENAYLNVRGNVSRKVNLQTGWTIPFVGSCNTTNTSISGLIAGTYYVDLYVVEGGQQQLIKTQMVVVP